MAKKTRAPQPPRRQQGPRRRGTTAPRRRLGLSGGAATRRNVLLPAVVAVVVLAVALAIVLSRRGGDTGAALAKTLEAAGCTFRTYPSQGQNHVQSLDTKVKYDSFPPTSGPHYQQPAVWNSYTQPLALVQEVHNLEHGGVIVQYGARVPGATVQQLTAFYYSSPNAMLLAPLPRLGGKIALTAWTHLATCTRFDETAFTAFRDAFRGKGPERFPISVLTPGS